MNFAHHKSNQKSLRYCNQHVHPRSFYQLAWITLYVRTDGRTDGPTDRPSYRDAWTHLKSCLQKKIINCYKVPKGIVNASNHFDSAKKDIANGPFEGPTDGWSNGSSNKFTDTADFRSSKTASNELYTLKNKLPFPSFLSQFYCYFSPLLTKF